MPGVERNAVLVDNCLIPRSLLVVYRLREEREIEVDVAEQVVRLRKDVRKQYNDS